MFTENEYLLLLIEDVIYEFTKAQQKWSDENLINLTGGATPECKPIFIGLVTDVANLLHFPTYIYSLY